MVEVKREKERGKRGKYQIRGKGERCRKRGRRDAESKVKRREEDEGRKEES